MRQTLSNLRTYIKLFSNKKMLNWHYNAKHPDVKIQDKHCTDEAQVIEEHEEVKAAFLTPMKK